MIEWCLYNFGSLFNLRRNGQNQLLAKKQVTFALLVLSVLFRLLKLEQAQKSLV